MSMAFSPKCMSYFYNYLNVLERLYAWELMNTWATNAVLELATLAGVVTLL